jgi:hypothetical protein
MTQAMAGDGAYERHSDHQVRDARSHAAMIAAAAERIVADDAKGSLVLADYGCAQGGVSNALMRVAIERIRRTYPDVPISVIHNDVLANDWATLLKNLRDGDGYLSVPGGPITPLISATSFYKPVTPRGLVDLGTSFAAIQWLGEPGPVNSGSALYFDQLEGTLRTDMARQAHADWTRFLELRADELAPGGRMVIDMMGMGEDGAAAGHDACRAGATRRIRDPRLRAHVGRGATPLQPGRGSTTVVGAHVDRRLPEPCSGAVSRDRGRAGLRSRVRGLLPCIQRAKLTGRSRPHRRGER